VRVRVPRGSGCVDVGVFGCALRACRTHALSGSRHVGSLEVQHLTSLLLALHAPLRRELVVEPRNALKLLLALLQLATCAGAGRFATRIPHCSTSC